MKARGSSWKSRRAGWACAALLLCLSSLSQARQINDPALRFSFTIPDQFADAPELKEGKPEFIHAFRSSEPAPIGTVIIIEALAGVLDREKLVLSEVTSVAAARLLDTKWDGFDIQTLELPESTGGLATLNLNTQVPLKPWAIQLRILGAADQKTQLWKIHDDLLTSLKGESNWLRSGAPTVVAESPHYGIVLALLAAGAVLSGVTWSWLSRRKLPRGTVLALAFLIYVTSWVIDTGRSRELRILVGSLRMIGAISGFLGVSDLLFRRKEKQSAEVELKVPEEQA